MGTVVPRQHGAFARFFDWFYITNFLMIASYFLSRQYYILHGNPAYSRFKGPAELFHWERQVGLTFAVMIFIKFIRRQSIDGFLAELFLYSKVVILFMTISFDVRIGIYYAILFIAVFLLFSQPVYDGPDKQEFFTPASFLAMVKESTDRRIWLVTFYAPWASACVHLEPVMAELSIKYTTEKLRFGKLDVSRWPKVAKENRIDTTMNPHQLPTLIMFENGTEIARIPHVYADGSAAKGRFRKGDIIKGFELDMRKMTGDQTKAEKKKQ